MRVLELYSGIGGMHYALIASGVSGTIVESMDINTVANQVYKHNFPKIKNSSRNIGSLSVSEIARMKIDAILMSPPCQPFTRVGLQLDAKDNRSSSLLHVLNLIPEIKCLKQILVENVKGFENSETRDLLVACLVKSGFNYKEMILSPCQFGIPNTRRRYYLLAKRNDAEFCFTDSALIDSLPTEILSHFRQQSGSCDIHSRLAEEEHFQAENEPRENVCYRLERIIEKSVDNETHPPPKRLLEKRTSVLDIRTPESRGSCCFTKAYGRYIEGTGSILSLLPQESLKEKFRELERLRDDNKDFSEALDDLKLRFFTPKEVSRLMCFPESFEFPSNTTDKQRYRLLGNSINVHVVARLIYLLNYDGNFQPNLPLNNS